MLAFATNGESGHILVKRFHVYIARYNGKHGHKIKLQNLSKRHLLD